jgi:hypothetical protein
MNPILHDRHIYEKITYYLDRETINLLDTIIKEEYILRMFYEYKNRLGHMRPIVLQSYEINIGTILLNLIKEHNIKFCHGCSKILEGKTMCDTCKNNLIPCDFCTYCYDLSSLKFIDKHGISACKYCLAKKPNTHLFRYTDIIEKVISFLEYKTNIVLVGCYHCYRFQSISIRQLSKLKLAKKQGNTCPSDILTFFLSNGKQGYNIPSELNYIDALSYDDCKIYSIINHRKYNGYMDSRQNTIIEEYCAIYDRIYKKYKYNAFYCKNTDCRYKKHAYKYGPELASRYLSHVPQVNYL